MQTSADRFRQVSVMLEDKELNLGMREAYKHIYHITMFEVARVVRQRAERAMFKYGNKANEDIETFNFRKKLNHL